MNPKRSRKAVSDDEAGQDRDGETIWTRTKRTAMTFRQTGSCGGQESGLCPAVGHLIRLIKSPRKPSLAFYVIVSHFISIIVYVVVLDSVDNLRCCQNYSAKGV